MNKFNKIIYFFTIIMFLAGCNSSHLNAPQNHVHIVKPGDTLYSIAKQHKIKLEHLVKINNIRVPHTLHVKQKIIIPKQYPKRAYTNQKNTRNYITPKLVTTKEYNKSWMWPAKGKIIKSFNTCGPTKLNGISIAGKRGDPVIATHDGKVVYSGNNLRGYGNLIIIKHDEDFLSAYAHNEKILVKEQQIVSKGQKIATMGDSDANTDSLHFEIRHKGKPIDPLKILTKKNKD